MMTTKHPHDVKTKTAQPTIVDGQKQSEHSTSEIKHTKTGSTLAPHTDERGERGKRANGGDEGVT